MSTAPSDFKTAMREAYEKAYTGSNRTAASWAGFQASWRGAGMLSVPAEPTSAMLAAADKVLDADPRFIAAAYRAMLAAAPTQPLCPECNGAGEFESAMHCEKCDACGGTGRVPVVSSGYLQVDEQPPSKYATAPSDFRTATGNGPGVGGPTYYVRHPDDSYSVADPQPTTGVGGQAA